MVVVVVVGCPGSFFPPSHTSQLTGFLNRVLPVLLSLCLAPGDFVFAAKLRQVRCVLADIRLSS